MKHYKANAFLKKWARENREETLGVRGATVTCGWEIFLWGGRGGETGCKKEAGKKKNTLQLKMPVSPSLPRLGLCF